MCKKSRVGQNTVKTMRNATHTHTDRKTPEKTMRNGELSIFLYSVARRLSHFFARKHRKNRCKNKTQVQFRVSKVPKLQFQHMPAKTSHHPARRQTHVLPTTTTTIGIAVGMVVGIFVIINCLLIRDHAGLRVGRFDGRVGGGDAIRGGGMRTYSRSVGCP